MRDYSSFNIAKLVRRFLKRYRILAPILFLVVKTRHFNRRFSQRKVERLIARIRPRIKGGSILIEIPEFEGTFELDPRSDIFGRILKWGEYEQTYAQLAIKMIDPTRDAIDVGANIGLYSVLIARHLHHGRTVLAIEPATRIVGMLNRNIERNNLKEQVIVVCAAASSLDGGHLLTTVEGCEEFSSLSTTMYHDGNTGTIKSEDVNTCTLDAIVKKYQMRIGFIKIDAEGWESEVLKGSKELLMNHRPIIIFEQSVDMLKDGEDRVEKTIKLLYSFNYMMFDAQDPDIKCERPISGEVLAVPAELWLNGNKA
jgi:FkbM family methyltransferase